MLRNYFTRHPGQGGYSQDQELEASAMSSASVEDILNGQTIITFEGPATAEAYARDAEDWYEHEADLDQDEEETRRNGDEEVSWREGISMIKKALF